MEGSKALTSAGAFVPHMAGQYVYLDGLWRLIHRVQDADTAHTDWPMTSTGMDTTPIVTVNDIRLVGSGVALTRLEVEYTPRVW